MKEPLKDKINTSGLELLNYSPKRLIRRLIGSRLSLNGIGLRQTPRRRMIKLKSRRNLVKQCSLTGGGVPPSLPDQEDGDDFVGDLQLNDFESTVTNYNGLVQPQDRIESQSRDMSLSGTSGVSGTSSKVVKERLIVGPVSLSSVPKNLASKVIRIGNNFGVFESVDDEEEDKLSETSDENESLPDPEGYKGVQHLGNKAVLLIDETGGKKVVNAAENAFKNIPKNTPKKPKKRNMIEEAANYYSSMLKIQEKLAK